MSTTAEGLSEEVYHVKGGCGKITEHSISVEKYNNWKEQRKHESSGSKREKKKLASLCKNIFTYNFMYLMLNSFKPVFTRQWRNTKIMKLSENVKR